ncbi:hypothetical protein SY88_02120 [Clostridiales bacterium PH28_bin88]|nr:hypothetical protein SY88_02120 [Clostridiales bacterium PH28_bin88]
MVDKHAKKLHTLQLIELITHAQLEQHRGLRDISSSLHDDQISEAIGLDSISASQISRQLRGKSCASWARLAWQANIDPVKGVKQYVEMFQQNKVDTVRTCQL